MTIVYQPSRDHAHYLQRFRVDAPRLPALLQPADRGVFVRRPRPDHAGQRPEARFEAAAGRWGLIPLFAASRDYPQTFEAQVETAAIERDFHQPWKRGHRCIVLADALFRRGDNDHRVVRVARSDGQPLALAGLWNGWRSPEGECVESFALLTLPAEEQPGERRVVFLRDGWVDDWLHCAVEEATACLRPYDLRKLVRNELNAFPALAQPVVSPEIAVACPVSTGHCS